MVDVSGQISKLVGEAIAQEKKHREEAINALSSSFDDKVWQ